MIADTLYILLCRYKYHVKHYVVSCDGQTRFRMKGVIHVGMIRYLMYVIIIIHLS